MPRLGVFNSHHDRGRCFHAEEGEWPAEILCPNCYEIRERKAEHQSKTARRVVVEALVAAMKVSDPLDRAQAVLPGAVAELVESVPTIGRALQTAARIAASWGIDVNVLL